MIFFQTFSLGSSFIWMSRSTSMRSKLWPDGNPLCMPSFTALGNRLLGRTVILARVIQYKQGQWLLEQPASSLAPACHRMAELAGQSEVVMQRVNSYQLCFVFLAIWIGLADPLLSGRARCPHSETDDHPLQSQDH